MNAITLNIWGLLIFAVLTLTAAVIYHFLARQARAVERMEEAVEDMRSMALKTLRAERGAAIQKDPKAWLREIAPVPLPEEMQVEAFPEFGVVRLVAGEGVYLLSERPFREVQKSVAAWQQQASALEQMEARLPFTSKEKARATWVLRVDESLKFLYFDEDAEAAGKAWGLSWGAPSKLYLTALG